MSAVQPPPEPADDAPTLDDQGRVIDLPAGALSSTRTPRGRAPRTARPRTSPAADLGAALNASLADVSSAAEQLTDGGTVPRPAAPRAPRPTVQAPAPAAQPRPRAVPRPPAWQPVPWSEASARAARSAPQQGSPAQSPRPRAAMPAQPALVRPAPARPAAPPRQAPPVRTAITLPFPTQHTRQDQRPEEEPARLRGIDPGTLEAKTVPGWLLMVMVVAVAAIACLAAYLLLRP